MKKDADAGPTVCSCLGVGRGIFARSPGKDAMTVPEVMAWVKAGGNCSSCVPELKKIQVETLAGTGVPPT
jgi:assimilatory nitrate reductase catalytic subunit